MTTLLDRKDRMSMGASLEVRVRFAQNHRIMEYLYNIPWEMKFYGGMEKGLLRKTLEGVLPDEVLYRKKIHIQKLIIRIIRENYSGFITSMR